MNQKVTIFRYSYLSGSILSFIIGVVSFLVYRDFDYAILYGLGAAVLSLILGYLILHKKRINSYWVFLILQVLTFQLWTLILAMFGIWEEHSDDLPLIKSLFTLQLFWNLYFGYLGIMWIVSIFVSFLALKLFFKFRSADNN